MTPLTHKLGPKSDGEGFRADMPDYDAYGQLWMAVLLKAVDDALASLPRPLRHTHVPGKCEHGCKRKEFTEEHYYQRHARIWLKSDTETVGSLRWICALMHLDAEEVRERVRQQLLTQTRRKHPRQPYRSRSTQSSVDGVRSPTG